MLTKNPNLKNFFFLGGGVGGGRGEGGGNSLKSQSGHLNIDPKMYAKYQNPSSSSSQDILLTRFSYCYNSKVVKGA